VISNGKQGAEVDGRLCWIEQPIPNRHAITLS
jgi:hypothetical protein